MHIPEYGKDKSNKTERLRQAPCGCNALGRAGLVPWALPSPLQRSWPGVSRKGAEQSALWHTRVISCSATESQQSPYHAMQSLSFFSLSSWSVGGSKWLPLPMFKGAHPGGLGTGWNLNWNKSMRNSSCKVFLYPQKKCVDSSVLSELMVPTLLKVTGLDFGKLVVLRSPMVPVGQGKCFWTRRSRTEENSMCINNFLKWKNKKETSSILKNSNTAAEVRIARAVKSF